MSNLESRYATALFDLAKERECLDHVEEDMEKLAQGLETSIYFARFIENPVIPSQARLKILNSLFLKNKLHKLTLDFLALLENKHRIAYLKKICLEFKNLYLKNKNILKVKITSATILDNPQLNSLSQKLKIKFNKEIELSTNIEPQLLAGFKMQVGDYIKDYSLQSQLENFRKNLIYA